MFSASLESPEFQDSTVTPESLDTVPSRRDSVRVQCVRPSGHSPEAAVLERGRAWEPGRAYDDRTGEQVRGALEPFA